MPLYEYICKDCGVDFEKRVSFSEADETQECPKCGSNHSKKKLSMFISNSSGSSASMGSSASNCGGGGRFT